jgi:outer membrane protein
MKKTVGTVVTLVLLATLCTTNSKATTLITDNQFKANVDADAAPAQKTKEAGKWYGRIGVAGIIYHPAANVSAGGASVPGASAAITNNVTVLFDAGYFVNKNVAVSLMAGIPAKPTLSGAGSLAPYGNLGAVWYGPAVLSAHYHFLSKGPLQPYAGVGLAYAIILKKHDEALQNLQIHNNFAPVAQAGADYMFNKKWGAFIDCKQIWLSVDAHGKIGGVVPATARVKLYPTVVWAGLKYRF